MRSSIRIGATLLIALPVLAAPDPAGLAARAAAFQIEHMPAMDRGVLTPAFLRENLELALEARRRFPWAARVPEDLFLNDVLPYASVDEARDPWRRDFLQKAAPLVAGCASATEAAQVLNREFFKLVNVHYSVEGTRANQSPKESMALGKVTCTGLSLILAHACRAVGIPARLAGIPAWPNKEGNHTWVEIWDGDWHFTGADEYDPAGLDRAWFVQDATLADPASREHAIYACSWRATGTEFPLAWSPGRTVPGVNVTARYAGKVPAGGAAVSVRLWDRQGGRRLVAPLELLDAAGTLLATATTKAGTADLNDMPRLPAPPGPGLRLRANLAGELREWPVAVPKAGPLTLDLIWGEGLRAVAGAPEAASCAPPKP